MSTSSWTRFVQRWLRPVAVTLWLLTVAAALALSLGPAPRVVTSDPEVVRVALILLLATLALWLTLRVVRSRSRWGVATAVGLTMVGLVHAVTLGEPTRSPVGVVVSLSAVIIALGFATVILVTAADPERSVAASR